MIYCRKFLVGLHLENTTPTKHTESWAIHGSKACIFALYPIINKDMPVYGVQNALVNKVNHTSSWVCAETGKHG